MGPNGILPTGRNGLLQSLRAPRQQTEGNRAKQGVGLDPSPWADTGSYALQLLISFLDAYGPEAASWAYETIVLELSSDAPAVEAVCVDRLLMAIKVLTEDSFYRELPTFLEVCDVLTGGRPGGYSLPDAEEVSWGITEAWMIAPPQDPEQPFSIDIVAYVDRICHDEGLVWRPDVLAFAGLDHVSAINDYADDPDAFAAIRGAADERAADIKNTIRARLLDLAGRLKRLRASTSGPQRVAEQIVNSLKRVQRSSR